MGHRAARAALRCHVAHQLEARRLATFGRPGRPRRRCGLPHGASGGLHREGGLTVQGLFPGMLWTLRGCAGVGCGRPQPTRFVARPMRMRHTSYGTVRAGPRGCLLQLWPCPNSASPSNGRRVSSRWDFYPPASRRAWARPWWTLSFSACTACTRRYRLSAWPCAKAQVPALPACTATRGARAVPLGQPLWLPTALATGAPAPAGHAALVAGMGAGLCPRLGPPGESVDVALPIAAGPPPCAAIPNALAYKAPELAQ